MIRYFQNTREITYMLIYLMALDTEEERIKFVRLYEDYRNRMHYTASILLKSEIEAEDIVHDTFLTLTDYLDRIDEKDSVGTWNYIVTILKNNCYNFLKRNKRIELTEDEEVFEQPVEMYNLLENQLIKEEAEEFLNTLIKGLKYPYREVIYLQYHNKLNSRQIAELLRTSPANVRKISSRAREQLKKGMQKKGYTCEYGF